MAIATTRSSIYSGIGMDVQADSVRDALAACGLDWVVGRHSLQLLGGPKLKDHFANVRLDENGKPMKDEHGNPIILGYVGPKYQIVQNPEALCFVDWLVAGGAKIVKAGTFRGGKAVWVLVQLASFSILGDEAENYLLIQNSFDAGSSIKICITPIRVWCQNMLNLAVRKAKHVITLRHTTNVMENIERVPEILGLAQDYTIKLADYAEELVKKEVDDYQLRSVLNGLFPITDKSSDLQKRRAEENKEAFYVCYAAPDLARFRGTAWGVINAVADLSNHTSLHKDTANYAINYAAKAVDGDALLNKVVRMVG